MSLLPGGVCGGVGNQDSVGCLAGSFSLGLGGGTLPCSLGSAALSSPTSSLSPYHCHHLMRPVLPTWRIFRAPLGTHDLPSLQPTPIWALRKGGSLWTAQTHLGFPLFPNLHVLPMVQGRRPKIGL